MAEISGGYVVYGETRKIAEYENKRAEVRLDFSVAPGEDHKFVATQAGTEARSLTLGMLGLIPKGGAPAVKPTADKAPEGKAAKEPVTIPASTSAMAPADPAAVAEAIKEIDRLAPDPAALDELDADILQAQQPEITDQAISKAVSAHNTKVNNAAEIRKLIGRYVPTPGAVPPQTTRDIPQKKRAAFLLELEQVKPGAPA